MIRVLAAEPPAASGLPDHSSGQHAQPVDKRVDPAVPADPRSAAADREHVPRRRECLT